jgi:tripartite-type tricarboxylate transporter receptor subunit TctC
MRRGLFAGPPVGAAIVAAVLALTTPAFAQSYPDRSVRIIIAFAAGGTIDTLGRIVAQ